MKVTFKGNPVTLSGIELKTGDTMPDFILTNNSLEPVSLKDTSGVRVFAAVPSIDTPVCDLEVRTFNEKISGLGDVKIYTVSMDLPFAQARWCGAHGITDVITLSDYKDRSFGKNTGTYVKELGLLTRAVFVVDSNNKITYAEYVDEIASPPKYEDIYNAVKKAK